MKVCFYPVVIFAAALALSYALGYTPPLVALLYVVASVVSYWLYAKDKRAAKKHEWRVPENSLHISAVLCGWPGALIAQQTLRHKTQKVSFRLVFWLTVVLNLSPLVWVHTLQGAEVFQGAAAEASYWVVELFGRNAGTDVFLQLSAFRELR